MSEFKVGDKVKIVGNDSGHQFKIGQVVEVIMVGSIDYRCCSLGDFEDCWFVMEKDAEIVDTVNSPSHYGNGKIECIDYIKDFLTTEEFIGYLRGNIAKYMHRFRYKNGIEDLKKSNWYLKYLTEFMEGLKDE